MNRSTSPTAKFLFAQAVWDGNTGEAGAHLSLSTTSNLGHPTSGINHFINIFDVLSLRDNLDQIITHILNSPDVNEPLKAKIQSELRWQKCAAYVEQELTQRISKVEEDSRAIKQALDHKIQAQENSREIINTLRNIINERDKAALNNDDPAYYKMDQAINKARKLLCNCGNPPMGFECSCDWTQKHPGLHQFSCPHCGIYDAAKPHCNLCQVYIPEDTTQNENE